MKITDELVDKCAIASINEWRDGEGLSPLKVTDMDRIFGSEKVRREARIVLEAARDDIAAAEEAAIRAGWNRARNLTLALNGPDIKHYPYQDGNIGLSLD